MSVRIGYTEIDYCFYYSSASGVFIDYTANINSGASTFEIFAPGSVGDILYIGHKFNRWERMTFDIRSGLQAVSSCVVWEYFVESGSAWYVIPSVADHTGGFQLSGLRDVTSSSAVRQDTSTQFGECGGEDSIRPGWGRATINGSTAFFWRARLDSAAGQGEGAVITSASIDLTLPSPLPRVEVIKFGGLHTAMCGARYFYQNGAKRTYTLDWSEVDRFDAMSARERALMNKITELTFPSEWDEDANPVCVICDPKGHRDRYLDSGLHDVTLVFLEV